MYTPHPNAFPLNYRIAEKFCELVKSVPFAEKTFADCLYWLRQSTPRPKLSRIATKPRISSPSKVSRYAVCQRPYQH